MVQCSRRRFLGLLPGLAGAIVVAPSAFASHVPSFAMNYGFNLDPLSYLKDGTMHGLLIDIMEATLSERMGMRVSHNGYPWARAQELLEEGYGDGICTNPTPARQRYALFSKRASLTIHFDLFYNLHNPRRTEIENIRTLSDLASFHIIDYRGNNLAKKTYPKTYDVYWAKSPQQIINSLAQLRGDVYIGNPLYAVKTIRELGQTKNIGRRKVDIMPPTRYHFGVRKTYNGAQEVVSRFDATIEAMERDGSLKAIWDRYF